MWNLKFVNEIDDFFFLTIRGWLNGLYSAVDKLFLEIVLIKMKIVFCFYQLFCQRFCLNVFYLCLKIFITVSYFLMKHTCSKAEEIKCGY